MRRILSPSRPCSGPPLTSAATVPYRSDAELVAISDRVIRGRVLDSVVERTPSGVIQTRTRLAVIEDFTGGPTILTVVERGGRLPDGATVDPGRARFAPATTSSCVSSAPPVATAPCRWVSRRSESAPRCQAIDR